VRASQASRRAGKTAGKHGGARVAGDARESVRDAGRVVVEAGWGIVVYPPETEKEPWRAVFTENGQRRYRQASTEAGLAAKLAKVTERLAAGAANAERAGADLIAHYLDPGMLRAAGRPRPRRPGRARRPGRRAAGSS
jgi:hypothetical protein